MNLLVCAIHLTFLLACTPTSFIHTMRVTQALRSNAPAWPPLLWSAQQSVPALAQTLTLHNITVQDYIGSQLKHARSQLLTSLIAHTKLTEQDLRTIAITVGIIQAYDAKKSTPRFTRILRKTQQTMRNHIPGIEDLIAECQYPYPMEMILDTTNVADVYSQRIIKSFICEIDGALQIALPDAGTFTLPTLFFGNSFWKASETEKAGAILREVGGHMRCEHGCELYLFEQVMKKRQTLDAEMHHALNKLEDLQALEADLIPAILQKRFAISISDWLKRENARFSLINGEERIRNIESVIELFEAVQRKQ